jgi:hypothetical protein
MCTWACVCTCAGARDDPGQNLVGNWEVHQESEITGNERCRTRHHCSLSLPQAKMAFMNTQSLDQMSAGVATDSDAMTTLDYDEFKECIARVAIDKYKSVKAMDEAAAIRGFCANLLREANEEELMFKATLIKAKRFDWRREAKPMEGEKLADLKSGSRYGDVRSCRTSTTSRCGRRACTTACRSTTRSSPRASLGIRARSPRTRPRTPSRCR